MNVHQSTTSAADKKTFFISMFILAVMFFIFGLVSWVNSILIPYFKIACELSHFQSYFVTFAFYIAYFVMAIPSGLLLKKVGFKKGILYGFILMAFGAFIFVPAAMTRLYGLFLIGLYSIGTGSAILQTAANPYVTIIGPMESAAQRMSIMGIFNKLAGVIAPLVFAAAVFKATDSNTFALIEAGALSEIEKNVVLNELIRRVIWPYIILGIFLLLVGIAIRFSVLPEIDPEKINPEEKTTESASFNNQNRKSLLDFPYLILGAIAILFHIGSQAISLDTIINYAGSMGINILEAKVFPSYIMICTIISYILGIILIPKVISQTTALKFCTILGLILSIGVIFASQTITLFGHTADISIWFLAALGFPNALIYAGIWPLSIHNLGKFTKTGSSLLVMGLVGNGIFPLIYGALADAFNLRLGYWVLIPCFAYLVWFAFYGYKINYWRKPKEEIGIIRK